MIYKFRSIQWPVSIALTFTYTKLKTELIVTDFTKNQGALLINILGPNFRISLVKGWFWTIL